MSEPTMIERVARALAADDLKSGTSFEVSAAYAGKYWHFYEAKARTAITAMRDMTKAMDSAGIRALDARGRIDRHVWRAMIDAALTEAI